MHIGIEQGKAWQGVLSSCGRVEAALQPARLVSVLAFLVKEIGEELTLDGTISLARAVAPAIQEGADDTASLRMSAGELAQGAGFALPDGWKLRAEKTRGRKPKTKGRHTTGRGNR